MSIFQASRNNQITAEYYFCLVGQINRGTCSKKVQKITRRNGSHNYETYHLISER
jgi:hypothetical protein